jgi:hypothetical protein
MSVNIGKLNNPLLYNYQYDQLNRIVAMDAFTGLDTIKLNGKFIDSKPLLKGIVSYYNKMHQSWN